MVTREWELSLSELTTVRLVCTAKNCGAAIIMPLEKLHLIGPELRIRRPCEHESFALDPENLQVFHQLVGAVKAILGQKGLTLDFILPCSQGPVLPTDEGSQP